MKKLSATICCILITTFLTAQTSYRKFLPVKDGFENTAIDVKRANDGGYLVLQTRMLVSNSKSDVFVTKFSSTGDSLWSAGLNGDQLDGGAAAMDIYSNDGSVFVGFQYMNGSNSNTAVGHIDKDGNLIGGSVHTFDLNDWESITSLTQTDDGGFVMTVNAAVQNGSYTGWIVKVKNDFTIDWQKEDSFYTYNKVIKQSLGSLVCVGTKGTGGCKMVKYSSVGNKLWEKTWTSGELYDVCEVVNNDLVAVGYGASFQAVKVSNTGAEQWKKNYYGSGTPALYPTFHGVSRTLDDQLIFSGRNNNGTTMDYFLAKSDNTGTLLWTKSFGSENLNANTHFNSIERTPDGGFISVANYDYDYNGFNEQGAFYKTDSKGQVANLGVSVKVAVTNKPIFFDDGKGGQGSITFSKLGSVKNVIIKVYGDSIIYNASSSYKYIKRFIDVNVLGGTGFEAAMKFMLYSDELNGLPAKDLQFLHFAATSTWEKVVPTSIVVGAGGGITAFLNNVFSFSPWSMGASTSGIDNLGRGSVMNARIYPVPASGLVNIEGEFSGKGNLKIELLDITGRLVKQIYEGKCPTGIRNFEANVNGMIPGIYLCRMTEAAGSSTFRLIVE